jgi:hypothetical protein
MLMEYKDELEKEGGGGIDKTVDILRSRGSRKDQRTRSKLI